MNNFKTINLDNGVFQIHPLRTSDLLRHNVIVDDLFEIFGDEATLPFNSEKIVKDKKTISTQLLGVTLGYEMQISYTHFLTLIENDKIIGEIIILSPKNVELAYKIKDTWIIEYFLNKKYWNRGIMTGVISAITDIMRSNAINKIGALVDRNNLSSIRVLEKVGFRKISSFDLKQDYFEI